MPQKHTHLYVVVGATCENEDTQPAPRYAMLRIDREYVDRVLRRLDLTRTLSATDPELYLMEYWSNGLVWACGSDDLERAEHVDVRRAQNAFRVVDRGKPALLAGEHAPQLGEQCTAREETIKVFDDKIEWEGMAEDGSTYFRTNAVSDRFWTVARNLLQDKIK